MRTELNPLREKHLPGKYPAGVPHICVIVHLPNDGSSYHSGRQEIVRASLLSLVKHADVDFHLTIWDNGGTFDPGEVVTVNRHIKTANIGKQNAMRELCQMYTGRIVGFADDDILYYPGWLDEQMRVYREFGGFVSGVTTTFYTNHGTGTGRKDASAVLDLDNLPLEWDIQHGRSIGMTADAARMHAVAKRPHTIQRGDVRAWVGGGHCQFICTADDAVQFLPYTTRYMEPLAPFDMATDQAGYYRTMTYRRTARHLGNRLEEQDRAELRELGVL